MFVTRFILSLITVVMPIFALADEVTIELNNGDKLTAELLKQSDEFISILHPALGELQIDKTKIKSTTHLQDANATTSEQETEVATAVDDNGLFGTGILVGWERRFDLGVAGSTGKSRSQQINLGFHADFESDYTRITHTAAYFRSQSEGVLTDSSFYATINRDWLRPETPWFHFAGGRVDLDEFKDWDYRLGGNGGIGYEFANTDDWLLLGRTGFGFSQTFGGARQDFTPEGLLGVETKWQMNKHQKIRFANTLYPSLKETSEFRNLTSFDWILDLNSYVGVALKVGLLNEYDSSTDSGISKNDFKYTVSLAWTL